MANPNGTPENLTAPRFKKGQSGNPGGLSSEAHKLIRENAERATRLRARLLEQLESGSLELSSELLKALKDAEDRGYGAPKQDHSVETGDALSSLLSSIATNGKRLGS